MKIYMHLSCILQKKADAEKGPFEHPTRVCKFVKILTNVTLVMAATTSRRIASLRVSIVRGFLLYAHPFSKPHKKKSGGIRQGDLGSHIFLEVTWSTK